MHEDKIKKLEQEIDTLKLEDAKSLNENLVETFYKVIDNIKTLNEKISVIEKPYREKIYNLKVEMNEKLAHLETQLSIQESLVLTICPHIATKVRYEIVAGGYLNRGSHITIWNCDYCNKEIDREETDTGHA